LFVALYAIISALLSCSWAPLCFCQITHQYQSQQHSACFSLFGIFWSDMAFSTSCLAFYVHLDVAALIHRRTVYVYRFLSVGPTYRAMGKVVACTIFTSNISL